MKRFTALLLAAALLCGCDSSKTAQPEAPVTSAVPDVPEADAPSNAGQTGMEMPLSAVQPAEEQSYTLDSVPYGKLLSCRLSYSDNIDKLAYIPEKIADRLIARVSEDTLQLADDHVYHRVSTLQTGENAIAAAGKMLKKREDSINSDIYISPPRWKIGRIEKDSIFIRSVSVSAALYASRTIRGFVRYTDSGAELIIDPAYMGDIPLFSTDARDMTFDINGETFYGDTLHFTVAEPPEPDGENSERVGGRYFYAELTVGYAEISYDTESGYENRAYLYDIKPLTDNTSAVLSGEYTGITESPLYRLLADGLDEYYTDDVSGITLLDMDLDGAPELLVTRGFFGDSRRLADVDVYSTGGGALTLLDTIHGVVNQGVLSKRGCSAFLGLKPLPDGSKAWFAMTAENDGEDEKSKLMESCKLFRLENGRITEEELFSCRDDGKSQFSIYINGERMEEKKLTDANIAASIDTPWGEIKGYSDYDVYCNLKNMYCADIEQNAFLCRDWLIATGSSSAPTGAEMWLTNTALLPSRRDIKIQLAKICEAADAGADVSQYRYVYDFGEVGALKPIIYLYPEEETSVSVKVSFPGGGKFTCTYPEYGSGWEVTAMPDGTLYDKNGGEYYCLYWEGEKLPLERPDGGWCVAGSDTADFLREKLLEAGLTPRETNEFIIYWLPQMQENTYNIISFHFDDYDRAAPLTVSPAPDSVLRLFMTFTPVEDHVEVQPQKLPAFERNGFTLVEWGGCEVG